MQQVALLVLTASFLLGGLPLTGWLFRLMTGKSLQNLGTGNASVAAAFLHGGRRVGILAACLEALRGVAVVIAARSVEAGPELPLLGLGALVAGRFWLGRAAGVTSAFWGVLVYSPVAAGLTALCGGAVWFILRRVKFAPGHRVWQAAALLAMPVVFYFLSGKVTVAGSAALLSGWLGYTLWRIPDDMALKESKLLTLASRLEAARAGSKATNLSRLLQAGLRVPPGWVLGPETAPEALLKVAQPSAAEPWVVRSSATGEDSATDSAAGQYLSVLDVQDSSQFVDAVAGVRASYESGAARQYRGSRGTRPGKMAVLVQPQIRGVYSGVLFTRDPVEAGERMVVEALAGSAVLVVGGQVTPERYTIDRADAAIGGTGDLPRTVLNQLYAVALKVEACLGGPQDIEWTWDGQALWVLQARPITTLQPVWTRTIASEVIPGVIRPLTWSINRPLTCSVWGEIFTIVLGKRAHDIDFNQTATLLSGWAYFNATLLGDIFLRMGLPTESLDFLYRGSRFSRPPLMSVLSNLPGLLRLVNRDLRLQTDFDREAHRLTALLKELDEPVVLDPRQLMVRSERIREALRTVTYFNILAPLGLALRRALLQVPEEWLNTEATAEVAAVRELRSLALRAGADAPVQAGASTELDTAPRDGQIRAELERFIARYGYLSEVGTDIAVPTWREHPETVYGLFAALAQIPTAPVQYSEPSPGLERLRTDVCRVRARLRARVAEVYDRLLAHLRWTFVAIEDNLLTAGTLVERGDIFFLEASELEALVSDPTAFDAQALVRVRKAEYEQQRNRRVPRVVYGMQMPEVDEPAPDFSAGRIKGIGASRGVAVGTVRVVHRASEVTRLEAQTVLVVPYTDAGWAPLLAQAVAIVAEVGGRLSHGAIIAREYGLPAVMNVAGATSLFKDGQCLRVDGRTGVVEVVEEGG